MTKETKRILVYLTALIYGAMGVLHLVVPDKFLFIMPEWMPYQLPLIYISGIAEILLALLLLARKTRRASSLLIVAMLIVYLFLIHIPQAIHFYSTGNKNLILSFLRIPLQFLFIYLIWPQKKISVE